MEKHEFYDETWMKWDTVLPLPTPMCVEKNPSIFLHKAPVVQMPLVVEPAVEPVVEPVVASPTDDVDVRSGGVEMPHAASFEHVSSKFLGFMLVHSSCGKGLGVWCNCCWF